MKCTTNYKCWQPCFVFVFFYIHFSINNLFSIFFPLHQSKGWKEAEGSQPFSPNSLQKRWTLILVLPVSFQIVSLFWEAVGTPGYLVKASFLYPPSFIVPTSWARKALVKPFQHLIPGQHQSLGTDLRLNPVFPHCSSHPHTKHLFASTN